MAVKDISKLEKGAEKKKTEKIKKKTGSSKSTKKTKKASSKVSNTKKEKAPKESAVKKSIKEIDIGTGVITGEEIKPVKKKRKKTAVKKTDNVSIESNLNRKTIKKTKKKYYTHDGHELTLKEYKFIDNYISTGNGRQSVIEAGYESKAPGQYANDLLNKNYIAHEIECRMREEHSNRIASGQEVMEFFTRVMNGEVKDQFGLDAPLSERIKAGQEIAKRTVDIANKIAGVSGGEHEVTIKLDWDRKGV